jgi:hypothetical protein
VFGEYVREVPGVEEQRQQVDGREQEAGAGILHVFGRQLKLCRERAGLDRATLGSRVGYSASTIASFEQAVELHVYATRAVPGLWQTEEYARAVCAMWRPLLDAEVIEQRVTARMARKDIFARRPAPHLTFVIEEAVLHRDGASPAGR